jgi:hypothetical protein
MHLWVHRHPQHPAWRGGMVSPAAEMAMVTLFCMAAAVLLGLGQLIAKRPVSWLRGMLSAVVVVGLAACLLAVASFALQK